MDSLLQKFSRAARTAFRQPVRVEEWARQVHAAVQPPKCLTSTSIRATDVVRWDRLGVRDNDHELRRARHILRGWGPSPSGSYEPTTRESIALQNLVLETTEEVTLDLQSIVGLSASKSDLSRYESLEEFAREACSGLMEEPSAAAVEKNMSWPEVRITAPDGPDHFCRFDWDGRIFLVNSGGSHHLAAARQMAQDLDIPVPLTGRFKTHRFHKGAVDSLRRDFEIFAIPSDPVAKNEFWEGMREAGAPYFSLPLPAEPTAAPARLEAVLLPRAHAQSMKVAQVLRDAHFWDVGSSLTELAMGAHRHRDSSLPPFPRPAAIRRPVVAKESAVPDPSVVARSPARSARPS